MVRADGRCRPVDPLASHYTASDRPGNSRVLSNMKSPPWLFVVALSMLTISACREPSTLPSEPRGVAALVQGKWAQPQSLPGISFRFQLAARDTVLSGSGTYSIEAGRSGTLSVLGFVVGQQLMLDITYDYGPVAHFTGSLADQNTLRGSLKYGPPDSEVPSVLAVYDRQPY